MVWLSGRPKKVRSERLPRRGRTAGQNQGMTSYSMDAGGRGWVWCWYSHIWEKLCISKLIVCMLNIKKKQPFFFRRDRHCIWQLPGSPIWNCRVPVARIPFSCNIWPSKVRWESLLSMRDEEDGVVETTALDHGFLSVRQWLENWHGERSTMGLLYPDRHLSLQCHTRSSLSYSCTYVFGSCGIVERIDRQWIGRYPGESTVDACSGLGKYRRLISPGWFDMMGTQSSESRLAFVYRQIHWSVERSGFAFTTVLQWHKCP